MDSSIGRVASSSPSIHGSEKTATEHTQDDSQAFRNRAYSSDSTAENDGGEHHEPTPNPALPQNSKDERQIVEWPDDDPENPYNWTSGKKAFVVFVGIVTVINSTLGSSLPSNASPFFLEEFGVTNEQQAVLPISLFLVGYIFGNLIFAPISEQYGRKWVTKIAFSVYMLFTMACALAPNFVALLIFRLICGIMASAPIAVTGGLYADVYGSAVTRGRAMATFMSATTWGPLFSPVISGYVSTNPSLGWRWSFWIGLIFAGVTFIPILFLPETYGPVLLSQRAKCLRKETGNQNIVSQHEVDSAKRSFKEMTTKLVLRPLRMLLLEPIVLSTSLYLSLAYAIFYMYFEAYPIVFQDLYQLSPGESGLMFLPIGAGSVISIFIFLAYERYHQRAVAQNQPWTQREEASRIPLSFVGGPLYVLSLFWLGWTARESIPFYVPMLAGIPFGMGFLLIFMALLNYLTDAYEIFAASAIGAASMCRSVFGAVLSLATGKMYGRLGVGWASTVLGFASLIMSLIPFVFFKYGRRIRERSEFCQELKALKEEKERGAGRRRAAKEQV